MLAEIVKHFYPRLVDLHNYVPTCNTDQKLSNWSVLNRKVFHKLRLWVSETEIQKVVANTPGAIEPILLALREKVKDGAVQQAPPPTASGPSRWVPGAPGFRAATVTGGKGAGPGRAAGDGQDFADESGQAGAPAEAKGAADWRADKNRDKSQ
uniref:CH-like domain-containing protein n=1 Tax=Ursus americanus TaxID=9643 RepID=A0A452S554_URSAM